MSVSSTADGSVVLSVDFNISDAEKELARLKSKVFKLEDEIAEKTNRSDVLKERFREAEKEFEALSKKKSSFDTMFFSPEEERRLSELGNTMKKLDAEIKKIDEDIDSGNISLEWTKERYGEITKIAEHLQATQEPVIDNSAREVSNQHIADLSKELVQLKQRLAELKKQGIGLGDKEFEEITVKIAEANREIKEYEKNLTSVSEVDLSGSAAKKVADEMFQGMADRAQEAMRWVERYRDELADLEDRKSSLGLALGARDEYKEIQSEIDSVTDHLEEMLEELDSLARSGALGALAGGSEIAEQRIAELNEELADLQQQQEKLGLAFGAKQEYEDLSAEIERVNELIEAYEKNLGEDAALRRMAEDAEIADERIVDLCEELKELEARQKELEGAGIGLGYQEYDDNVARIAEIKQELKEYQKALSNANPPEDQSITAKLKAAEKMGSILKRLSQSLGGSGSIGAEAASTAESLSAAATGMEGLTSAAAAAGPVVLGAVAALTLLKLAADKIAKEAKRLVGSFVEALQKGAELLKNFGKASVKAFQLATEGVLAFLDQINVFPKMFSSISKSLTKLGQMIRRVFVFSVITSGLRLVRTQMNAYLNVNAQFTNALRQLKGVLLTAFQPIYDVVVPALTTLLNVLARAIAAVTQFTAVLFGTTAKQAQKNAQALYEQANATSAAGSAAEEASLQMASFDEINKLEGNKSAGGGGGASANTGPLFDWEYEDTPFPDWGEAFDAFLDKLLGNIPKLKEAFKSFADWLNNLAQKLYDMFTFPGVLDKVKQLGRDLADAFNDLVNWIDWNLLGRTLGAGLNLALNFLTSFIYEFDWMNLGRKLAEFINGLVAEIDWYEFGRLLWAGWKIGLETLAGFILGLDMPQLAQAASNIVLGFFDEMLNTIRRIPWGEIGAQIAEFLVNLDWYGMLSSVTSAIAAGLMAAVAAVRGFLDRIVPELDRIAQEIVQALIEFFRDKVEWDEMARTIGDGITAALHFVADLLDPELFYEIGKTIGDFFINLQWVEIFGGLTEVLANGINAAIAALKGFLDSVTPEKLKEIADGIAQKINEFVGKVDWAELGQTISRGIEAAIDFMIELMDQIDWDAVGAAICDFLENIDWETLLAKWGTLMGEFINAKLKSVDLSGALNVGMQIIAGLAQGMINKFNASGGVSGWLKSLLVDPILNGVMSLFGIHSPSTVFAEIGGFLIAGLAQGISDTWGAITDFFGEKLDALKQNLSDAWENIKTTASEKWGSIKEALGAKWDEIRENAKTKFDEVKEKVSEVWGNIKTEAPQKWEEIKTSLATAWDNVKTSADEKFTNIKESIIDIMGKLKDNDWEGLGSSIMNKLWDGLKNIWNSISTWASGLGDKLSSALSSAKSAISSISNSRSAVGGISLQSVPDVTTYRIPALAQGAVIPPNREFLAVLGDQRSGTNIEAPVSEIEGAVARGIQAAGGAGGNRPITVILQLDRRELGRVVYEVNNEETQRVGVRLAEVRG